MKQLLGFLIFLSCNNVVKAQQLVMPGDHPDPSVVKIGDTYWASATTSNWFPAYPLLKSKDLVNWQQVGHVFNQLPAWADFYFWAPEISYENGKVYIYYAAHKKGGNLCVGVASADKPEGPYRDHGPLICQEVGSIDAWPMRDVDGKLYMIWKEDGNSVGKPTPIWAQQMNEERTALVGEKRELFHNDAPWEANLVEGVSMIKKGEYYYAFYAGAGCCGAGCTYATGIARSKSLFGPWEKYNRNPVMANAGNWICPGHGTPIEKDGKYYFLYHAYDKATNIFTGRQGLLMEFRFTPDNWIEFVPGGETARDVAVGNFSDAFSGRKLSNLWQWSVFQNIDVRKRGGELHLAALPAISGAFLGQKILKADLTATTMVHTRKSTTDAGIGAIGDENNLVMALYRDGQLKVIQVKQGKETVVAQRPVDAGRKLYVRMQVRNGKDLIFSYSNDGKQFTTLNEQSIEAAYLPPWDRALRVALVARGENGQKGVFDKFEILYQ
jgi:beta-xylosidase